MNFIDSKILVKVIFLYYFLYNDVLILRVMIFIFFLANCNRKIENVLH